jgi:hypothetical protein
MKYISHSCTFLFKIDQSMIISMILHYQKQTGSIENRFCARRCNSFFKKNALFHACRLLGAYGSLERLHSIMGLVKALRRYRGFM